MLRRDILKGMAAATALQAFSLPSMRAFAAGLRRRVRPGDAGWPNTGAWQKLSDAVGGNLIKVQPLFAPCEADPKSAACGDVASATKVGSDVFPWSNSDVARPDFLPRSQTWRVLTIPCPKIVLSYFSCPA